jgi:hypothetical protein
MAREDAKNAKKHYGGCKYSYARIPRIGQQFQEAFTSVAAHPVHDQYVAFGSFPLNYAGPNVGQCDGKHHRIAWALSKAEGDIEFAGII